MRKTERKKRGKRRVCNVSSDSQKKRRKNIKKSKNASNIKRDGSKDALCLYCLDAYSGSASGEMWIQCTECNDGSPILCLKMNALGCMLFLHCVSFASNLLYQFK